MPSHSTLNSEEKDKIKRSIQSGKIVAAAIARIYYAYPEPDEWSYSGVEGALVFGSQDNGFWLRVVDLGGTRGVIWEHEFYEGMDFNQDRTFFYSFASDDCMIGIAFSDESEASELGKKIANRRKYAAKKTKSKPSFAGFGSPTLPNFSPPSLSRHKDKDKDKEKTKKRGFLSGLFDRSSGGSDRASISDPSEVKHISHVGVDNESGGYTTDNVDPEWEALLDQLQSMGISRDIIMQNKQFIQDFLQDADAGGGDLAAVLGGAANSAPPPSHAPPPPPGPSPAAAASAPSRAPPAAPSAPPPPPPGGRAGPPPPPREHPCNLHQQSDITLTGIILSAPPAGRAPTAPPPPPAGRAPTAPPPPPPGGRAPGPPAPPAARAPPPPPVGGAPPAPAQDGRTNLLASIRSAGGIGQLKKVDPNAPPPAASAPRAPATPTPDVPLATPGADQGNLAAALAAALTVRRAGTGDSDDEADSEDEEW
ncbi:hypothetical protein EMMF5_003579 [Cystobasidiomycetes sp. EMM_F5]